VSTPKQNRKSPKPSEAVEWADYPRIEPGEYLGYCCVAKSYFDHGFKRWVCILRFSVVSANGDHVAYIPMWLSLGQGNKPRAARRGKYFPEWIRANGGAPTRDDRLSLRVFQRRFARIEVGDTEGPAPYSVVKKILSWETGVRVTQSDGQPSMAARGKTHRINELREGDGRSEVLSQGFESGF
jgi:hypothetical protein